MARRYLVETLPAPGRSRLPADTGHHLAVMRVREGDAVVLFDGKGSQCEVRVVSVRGRRIEVEASAPQAVHRLPARHVELAFALPKGTRAEWLFEHATEIGVAALRPIVTARTDGGPSEGRRERWLRVVRAAAGQCDRSHLPVVHDVETLSVLLARGDLARERYVALPGAPPLATGLGDGAALLLVGPPGGLEDGEIAAVRAAGFEPGGLGPLTLRTETAALVGAALLLQKGER